MGPGGGWAGGRGALVQTGDAVDRGPDSLAVLSLLARLKVPLAHPSEQPRLDSTHLGDRLASRVCARRRLRGVRGILGGCWRCLLAFVGGEPWCVQKS